MFGFFWEFYPSVDVEQPYWEIQEWARPAQTVDGVADSVGVADLQKQEGVGGDNTDDGDAAGGIGVVGCHVDDDQHRDIPDEEFEDSEETAHLLDFNPDIGVFIQSLPLLFLFSLYLFLYFSLCFFLLPLLLLPPSLLLLFLFLFPLLFLLLPFPLLFLLLPFLLFLFLLSCIWLLCNCRVLWSICIHIGILVSLFVLLLLL